MDQPDQEKPEQRQHVHSAPFCDHCERREYVDSLRGTQLWTRLTTHPLATHEATPCGG